MARRCAQHPCIIVSQDTTEPDFTHMQGTAGLGPSNSEVFSVSDREGDIYEIFEARQLALEAEETAKDETKKPGRQAPDPDGGKEAEGRGPVAHWLIRANQDRAVLKVEGADPARLFAALAASPSLGNLGFEISAKNLRTTKKQGLRVSNPRSARRVRQTIRVLKITPRPPRRPGKGKVVAVAFWAILAEEQNAPEAGSGQLGAAGEQAGGKLRRGLPNDENLSPPLGH